MEDVLEAVSKKLSILVALQLRESGRGVQEHIATLQRFHLSTQEIADILGTTPGTVAVAKARLKKKRRN